MNDARPSRAPALVAVVYLALVALGLVLILVSEDALSGVFAVILTLPWSSLLSTLLEGAVPDLDGTVSGLLGVVVGAAINATILYVVVRALTSRRRRRPA